VVIIPLIFLFIRGSSENGQLATVLGAKSGRHAGKCVCVQITGKNTDKMSAIFLDASASHE
jgi:hypothetical protein